MSFFRRKSDKRQSGKKVKASPSPTPVQSPVGTAGALNGGTGYGLPTTPEMGAEGQDKLEPTLLLYEEDNHPGDLGVRSNLDSQIPKSSRLSKSFEDLMKDREAIPHLIQYLETQKASNLIRFWLDAESFQASTWTRIRTHSLNTVSKSSLLRKSNSVRKNGEGQTSSQDESSGPESSDLSTNKTILPGIVSDQEEGFQSPSHTTADSVNNESAVTHEVKGIPNVETSINTSCEGNSGTTTAVETADNRTREKCKSEDASVDSTDNVISEKSPQIHTDQLDSIEHRDDVKSAQSNGPTTENPSSLRRTASAKTSLVDLNEKLKKSVEQDAVRVYSMYLAQDATHPIAITDHLRNEAIRKICCEDGEVDPKCFEDCQEFAFQKIKSNYYGGFMISLQHCKHQVEILTGGSVYLSDVLFNETALFYFMEYMEREGLSHLLLFWMAVDNFYQTLTSQEVYDGMEAQGDAMVIYDKYFSLQADKPLGFPDAIRFEVESNICREEGPLPDCFFKPREIVLRTVDRVHLPRYLQSDVYYRYLSELVSSAQTAQDFPLEQRKRRGSESSSEHSMGSVGGESISSKNTLLAKGQSRHKQPEKLREEITIDSNLLNPDLLWKRSESNMSLGKIDTLGSFVSDFVPDPEVLEKKKTGSKSFFRSKKDKEKEEEELARQVAQMILNDVTSITQAIGEMKNVSDKANVP